MLKTPSIKSETPFVLQPASEALVIATRADADRATIEYARLLRTCERLQQQFDEEVEHLYRLFHREYAENEARAAAYELAIVTFAEAALEQQNVGKAKPAKSLKLALARVKFGRDSDRVIVHVKTEELLANLRLFNHGSLIQQREFVEADDLRTIRAELREQIGFSIEPSKAKPKIDLDHHGLSALASLVS